MRLRCGCIVEDEGEHECTNNLTSEAYKLLKSKRANHYISDADLRARRQKSKAARQARKR